jgi:hypothetical protein
MRHPIGAAMPTTKYAAFDALGPYFEIVQKALSGLVDGEHYFDTIADDAFFELLYLFPVGLGQYGDGLG